MNKNNLKIEKQQNRKRGVSLYLTILILSILLSSVLTLSGILANQMRIIFNLGDAVTAFSAADAGVEQALYNIRRLEVPGDTGFPINFANGATVDITVTIMPTETIIKSIGAYNDIQRAIEVRY